VKPTIADRVEHINVAIARIRAISATETRESFADNETMRLAIERLFEIISEASRHIPTDMKSKESGINWRRLADLGNRLRHAYDQVDEGLLWAMIEHDLEPLKIFVERIVKESGR
jgi:uncharacterized protein with HEPN domain